MGEIKDKSVRDILKEILAQDKNLLGSRDALVEKLDEAIPGALARDFNPIKAALQENVGEMFLAADSADEEGRTAAKEKILQLLRDKNIQDRRAQNVVDAFIYALGWESAPTGELMDGLAEDAPNGAGAEAAAEKWICSCGEKNTGKFCTVCGTPREAVAAAIQAAAGSWTCSCGQINTGKFCVACGNSRPGAGASPVGQSAAAAMAAAPATVAAAATTAATAATLAAPAQGTQRIPLVTPPSRPMAPVQQRVTLSPPQALPPSKDEPMKVILILVIVVLLGIGIFFVVKGGFGSSGTGSKFSPTTKQSTDKKAPKVDSDLSLGGIEIGYSLDKVHEILGKENSQETMKQGRVRYKYDHMNVIIYNGMVTALESNDGTVETKRGLHQDAALQAVFDAYGKDYELTDYNDLKLYEYTFTASNGEKGLLRFAVNKSDGKVNYITIRLPDPEPPKAQADVEGAKTVLARYEKAIGQHDFTTARNCLVPAMKGNLNSDGYKTTVSSEIVSMNVLSAESDKVELSYRLQAKDRSPSGSINTKYFTGTATMRYMDGGWLISGMESKEE